MTAKLVEPTGSNPLLVVISGPSGVGKDAVISRMREMGLGYRFAVTATTRRQRENEVDGAHYFFYSEEAFREMIADRELLEWAEVYGNLYGVPKRQVAEALDSGLDVIVKTDVQGAATIKQMEPHALLIFIAPPNMKALAARLKGRMTEAEDDLALRMQTAESEMKQAEHFDHVVTNHDGGIDHTVREIEAIIASERAAR